MAQELELIVELLREMKRANSMNSESFDRLLASINKKLEIIDNNTASSELIKAYLGDLSKTLEEKYSTTLLRFSEIENALKAVFKAQDEHVKTKDIKELFEIFTKNLNDFYSEARQQKALISGIETRIAEISSDKSDKEDILRTITLLRNDFENLNHSYKNAIDNVNSDLKTVLSSMIKLDQSSMTSQISEQLDIMLKATNEIVSYLTFIDKRETSLEKILSNVATNENLKITQGVIDSIIKKSEEISEQITNLADKSDIEGLQIAASIMNNKLDETATKDLYKKISTTTDSLVNQTDEVKQTLANVTKHIETLPDINVLEDALQNLFKKLENLSLDISKINTKENIEEINTKIANLIGELSTVKDIVTDLNDAVTSKVLSAINDISFENQSYDIKSHVSKMLSILPQKEDIDRILENNERNQNSVEELLKKTDILADRLDNLPTHKDMESLNNNQLSLVENLQEVADKSDIEKLYSKTDDLEELIDKLNFDSEFEHIYDKTSDIHEWLTASKIKENSEELLSYIPEKADRKDVVEILATSKKIAEDLEELSRNTDAKKVNRTVADLYSMIEELKNDFIHTSEMHNDSIIVALSELQNTVSDIVTSEELNSFIENLKTFIEKTVSNTENIYDNISELKELQNSTLETLNNINTDKIVEVIKSTNIKTENKITNLSDFLENLLNQNTSNISNSISEISEILENKNSNIDELIQNNTACFNATQEYIQEIKTILDTTNNSLNEDITKNLTSIEKSLEDYKSANQNSLSDVIEKINDLKILIQTESNNITSAEFQQTQEELNDLKNRIEELKNSFSTLTTNNDTAQNNISNFITEKLTEISDDISNAQNNLESKMQYGFSYNAELIEEKTAALLDLIKELRHDNTENIDLYEKLTVTDNKLMDVKQELELVNTDITNTINSKTETIIEEIEPIKELISKISQQQTEIVNSEIKEQLGILHESIQDELAECTKYSKTTYEKLEDIYTKISNEISASENSLRNYILGDIDSVIIKIDALKADLEDSLNNSIPPKADNMAEFQEFISQLNSFKENQKILLSKAVQDIKTSISEQIAAQNEEFKSIITISNNKEEIIEAIDNLKECFISKVQEIAKAQQNTNNDDEFDINQYEKEFEPDENKILTDIKNDFSKFSDKINNLSDKNTEIEEILNIIKNKIETINISQNTITNAEATPDIDEKQENTTEISFSCSDNFDVIKALDLLKEDIRKLHQDINNTNSINKDWLDEVKTYLAGDEIRSMLEQINEKIGILTLTGNSDWIGEIKDTLTSLNQGRLGEYADSNKQLQSMLNIINEKVDILASNDNYDLIEEVRDAIENIDNNKSNISENLFNSINQKLDILASSDNYELIEEIYESIKNIENSKTSTDAEKLLNSINQKIDIIASTDTTSENLEDIKDCLDSLEAKLEEANLSEEETSDTIKKLSESDVQITSMLEVLNHKIDILASDDNTDTQIALDEVKNLILSQQETLENLESNNKTEAFKKCLEELTNEVNSIKSSNSPEVQKALKEMKDSIMNAVVSIFEQVSFVEESEDIKDFVEEKTDEINKNLIEVTEQLKQITNSGNEDDYTYSMQDIESDLAKLRIALNELQTKEQEAQSTRLSKILDNINNLGSSVENLQNSISNDEINELKSQLNQFVISSGESYNELGRILTGQLSAKIDKVTGLLEKSNASDKVMRQALIYIGEWIDSASSSMNKISVNSDEITNIKTAIETLNTSIPEHKNILCAIEEKFDKQQDHLLSLEKQINRLSRLENRFEQQQERIDRLEMALERILSAVEDIDDSKVNKKIDKIDKQIMKLSTNIEKLASYVD